MPQLISVKEFFCQGRNPEDLVEEHLFVEMNGRLQPRAQLMEMRPNTHAKCGKSSCHYRNTCFTITNKTGIPMLLVTFFDEEDNQGSSVWFSPCGGWAEKLFIDETICDTREEFTLKELKKANDNRSTCVRCKKPLESQTWFLGEFKFCGKCELYLIEQEKTGV